jgi:hypothetical protein
MKIVDILGDMAAYFNETISKFKITVTEGEGQSLVYFRF